MLLKNSLLVSIVTTVLAVGLGFAAALFAAGLPRRGRTCYFVFAVAALALPPFLVVNCWIHLLGPVGVWRGVLPLNILSLPGTVLVLTLLLWPIPLLAVWSAWQRLEPAQLEIEPALGGWPLIRFLLFPLARTAALQAAVLVFVLALNNFAVPAILQVQVFPVEAWIRFNTAFDTAGALGLSAPLILAPLLALIWFSRRGMPWPHVSGTVSAQLFRRQVGPTWFFLAMPLALVLCGLSVAVPLGQILSLRRTWTELGGALAAGQTAVWNSFWFALLGATLVLGMSLAANLPYQGNRRPWARFGGFHNAIGWVLWLPFLVPGVLLGIGLIHLFNHSWSSWFYQSAGIVLLAFFIRYVSLGWNTVAHSVQATDPNLVDVARLEGANGWQMFRHVLWPQIRPQITIAWYVVFLLCLWDVESMILVMPPGGETLAVRIFNLLHYGYNPQVNALCVTLLALALLPLCLYQVWELARPWLRAQTLAKASLLLLLAGVLPLGACSRSNASNGSALPSRIFSRVEIIGSRGVGVGQLNKPRSVAVDGQDNVYVVDMTGRVQKFTPDGHFVLLWQMPQTQLGKPKGMCRDRHGNIIVLEPHYSRVNHFSTNGQLVAQWGERGTNAGQLTVPRAVAVNSRGEIFLSEYLEAERVQKFMLDSSSSSNSVIHTAVRFLASFGTSGTGPGEFNRPEGLCVDAQDRVYVADSCNHRIQVFASDGKLLRDYGKPGKGLGELSYPYDICVDAAGLQYVCEFGNSRIQVFDAQDRPIEIIGGPGSEPGQFSNPWSVALDSAGNLYVADSQNHRVQKLIRNHTVALANRGDLPHGIARRRTQLVGRGSCRALITAGLQPRPSFRFENEGFLTKDRQEPRPTMRTLDVELSTLGVVLVTMDCGLWTADLLRR